MNRIYFKFLIVCLLLTLTFSFLGDAEAQLPVQSTKPIISDPLQDVKALRTILSQPIKDNNAEAELRLRLGKLLLTLSQSKSGFSQLLTSDSLYAAKKNLTGRTNVLSAMAAYCEKYGILPEAGKYYSELLNLQDSAGEQKAAGLTALHLADVQMRKEEINKASSLLNLVVNRYGRGDAFITASASQKLAEINRLQKNYRQAESLILKRALPLYRSAGNPQGRIGCFNVLARVYQNQKRYSEAKWFFIQALMQSQSLKNIKGQINALIGLASVKTAIGDANLAAGDLTQAERLARSQNDPLLILKVNTALAGYRGSGNNRAGVMSSGLSDIVPASLRRLSEAQAESVRTAALIVRPVVTPKAVVRLKSVPLKPYIIISAIVIILLIVVFILLRKKRVK